MSGTAPGTLQPAGAGDLPAIRALLAAENLPQADLTTAHLHDFLVLRAGGGLAGVAGLEVHGTDALLRSVVVPRALRAQGLGAALVAAAEAQARARGVTRLYLLTTTAAPFFAHRGYRVVDRREAPPALQASPEFSALCPASATCMARDLGR